MPAFQRHSHLNRLVNHAPGSPDPTLFNNNPTSFLLPNMDPLTTRVETLDGYPASITDYQPDETYPLRGWVTNPFGQIVDAAWTTQGNSQRGLKQENIRLATHERLQRLALRAENLVKHIEHGKTDSPEIDQAIFAVHSSEIVSTTYGIALFAEALDLAASMPARTELRQALRSVGRIPPHTTSLDASLPNADIVAVNFSPAEECWGATQRTYNGGLISRCGKTEAHARRAAELADYARELRTIFNL